MNCSKPIFVPLPKGFKDHPDRFWIPARFDGFSVPCGKCVACVKNRQNDFACRIARAAAQYGSMIFVTFTYRDDTVPISVRLLTVDPETGDCDCPSLPHILLDDAASYYRDCFAHMRPGRRSRRLLTDTPFPDDPETGLHYMYEFTPSLNRRDLRLWLKNVRVRYERDHGFKLPEFKYCFVGEYGPKTCRPHIHACFLGLNYNQVSEICQSWREKYGFVYIEAVKRVNESGSSGFIAASRYLGKYISKGVVECDSVTDGLAQKPRMCASLNLGTELSETELYYYSAYDLYGMYDPDRLCLMDRSPLSDEQIRKIQSEIFKRSTITIDNYSFLLPRAVRDKIWKYEDKLYVYNGKLRSTPIIHGSKKDSDCRCVKRSLRSFKIRTMAAVSASLNFFDAASERLHNYIASKPLGSVSDLVRQFEVLEASITQAEETSREQDFASLYSSSVF